MDVDKPLSILKSDQSSLKNKTGSWSLHKPSWDKSKCKHCLLCALYCPENAIKIKNGKRAETDFNYCKGCGICAQVCPFHAIKISES